MTRKPAFWVAITILGLAGSVLAFRLFPVAFPILSVEIGMDREEALAQALALGDEFAWGPADFRQAASFGHQDPTFQTYMELEGGGLEELNRLVEEGTIQLYAWRVRHFTSGTVEETEVRFSARGRPYGFRSRLSEETPGESLTPDEARNLALEVASNHWGMDPSQFELLESSQEEQPGGRLDHRFVYERTDLSLGEASLRIRLAVSGSQLTEVTRFFHVPQAFLRRYQETRNANESISLLGTIAFFLIFLVVGGGVGATHLLRRGWMEWKAPLVWGAVVAGLMALGTVNALPLAWMVYDSAVPEQVYVAQQVIIACVTFVAGTLFLALVFMVGEGLMRLGFPDQIQQWKIWSPGVANTSPALGRTVGPYLILGLELAFVVGFYLVMSRYAGWWSPASALAQPDLLATHFPWLSAVSTSAFAALSEETIFRAIPIGAAAFLGRKHGKAGLWIWGAVVLQALVFGASHANYPQQPAYARVVEIFPVYLGWGAVCVYFGLVPSIIAHFLYDLIFFSLPLFAADTPGIWMDRAIVIGFGALPLAVVFIARWRAGPAAAVPEWALNRNWSPGPGASLEPGASEPQTPIREVGLESIRDSEADRAPMPGPLSLPKILGLTSLGILGMALWTASLDFGTAPRMALTKSEAEARARSVLGDRGVALGPEWTPQFSETSGRGLSHQYVWKHGSEEDYRALVGDYLNSPGWEIRFISFQVPPEERAESFTVTDLTPGQTPKFRHALPEGRPGEALSEDQARILAFQALDEVLETPQEAVRELSAEEAVRPERRDWLFTFEAESLPPLADVEGRLGVQIAGSEVVNARKYIHVPEDWEREWRADSSRRSLSFIPPAAALLLLALGVLIMAAVMWSRRRLDPAPLRAVVVVLGPALLLSAIAGWPNTQSVFTTQLSLANQTAVASLGIVLSSFVLAVAVGLFMALGYRWMGQPSHPIRHPALVGVSIGLAYIGISNLLWSLGTPGLPAWPTFDGAVSYMPGLSTALSPLITFLTLTAGASLLLSALERLKGTRWSLAGLPILLIIGLTLAPNPNGGSWLMWVVVSLAIGTGVGGLWVLCRRIGWAILPGIISVLVISGEAEAALNHPFPGHTVGAVLGILGVTALTFFWTRSIGERV